MARTTGQQESDSLGRMPRDEAKQLSVERRMNQVKATFCDAIKGHAQNLIAPLISVQPKRQCVLKLPGNLRIHLRRQHATLAIGRECIKPALVAAKNVYPLCWRLRVDLGELLF